MNGTLCNYSLQNYDSIYRAHFLYVQIPTIAVRRMEYGAVDVTVTVTVLV